MSLREYRRKRDFRKTVEPVPERESKKGGHRFVVQKHAASRLHYDFRLEMDGTLKSWAVPKGVPFTKGEKRLAVQVEDHPISYINFEGTIPKGQYGGGTVMVWDKGTFEPASTSPQKDLAGGKLHFELHGKKLQGAWYLVRLRDSTHWLLIRGGADMRPVSKRQDDTSAASGKNMKQISEGKNVWNSNGDGQKKTTSRAPGKSKHSSSSLEFIEPMKARLVDSPPTGGDWIYEIKFDGFRALALKTGEQVQLLSRNNKDLTEKFPEIAESLTGLEADDAIVDGEIVALDEKGRSSFQLLQAREIGRERPPTFYYAFDLLQSNGEDLRKKPLAERKEMLAELLQPSPTAVRYSASLGSDAAKLLKKAQKLGLEGLIGKQADSHYEAGRRSGKWIKLKLHQEQEFVIGGYTNPEGARKFFGALLVGYHEKKDLRFCGKVGTGFDTKLLKNLHERFERLTRESCPFNNIPEQKLGRFGAGVTKAEMQRCHWISPEMVCQVRFSEWTRDGKLRQPVFLGVREDKDANEVIRETAS